MLFDTTMITYTRWKRSRSISGPWAGSAARGVLGMCPYSGSWMSHTQTSRPHHSWFFNATPERYHSSSTNRSR